MELTDNHQHRYVDGGICEVCGSGMFVSDAYDWAEHLVEEAIDTLRSTELGVSNADYHEHRETIIGTVIALGAALEQLREDKP